MMAVTEINTRLRARGRVSVSFSATDYSDWVGNLSDWGFANAALDTQLVAITNSLEASWAYGTAVGQVNIALWWRIIHDGAVSSGTIDLENMLDPLDHSTTIEIDRAYAWVLQQVCTADTGFAATQFEPNGAAGCTRLPFSYFDAGSVGNHTGLTLVADPEPGQTSDVSSAIWASTCTRGWQVGSGLSDPNHAFDYETAGNDGYCLLVLLAQGAPRRTK